VGITVLEDWIYRRVTFYQFPVISYKHKQTIDFNFLKKFLTKFNREDMRKNTLAKYEFTNFENRLHKIF
jgi:hypothetical protein